eukprot:9433956-Pyramimonas_sp.AAC.1
MRRGWSMMGLFWHERGLRRLKRELCLSTVVEKGLAGLAAFVAAPSEHARVDTIVVRYLRVLMEGSATEWGGTCAASRSNAEVRRAWQILPSAGELAVRR